MTKRGQGWPAIPSGKEYFTTANPPCCSCRDWEFRGSRTGRWCKHIKALAAAERLIASNARRWASVGVDNRKGERDQNRV